ncbi:MAG: SAM-dependent chlorinase/fluorinase [Candidatus Thermoplasmatota archaeon]|jgi:hypothetical protein|nr:SAM-dependent chlorinase/fluorinase [Candidatus Thermoplasmatota archaeon]MDP7265536.1 SAM-dependent chlorinase/fluorinase [Candidatus Thermoplasmatota archaeon]
MTGRIVTLTTDFGESHYVAQMKGILFSQVPDVTIIDISHNVTPQNIYEGAYILRSSAKWFRTKSRPVHVCVVDPTVGSSRKPICILTEKGIFIGPDNGVLYPAAEMSGMDRTYEIAHKSIFHRKISNVFHGRDVFARAAAMIIQGLPLAKIGPALELVEKLDLYRFDMKTDERGIWIKFRPLHIDRFGNIISSLKCDVLDEIFAKNKPAHLSLHTSGHIFPITRRKAYYKVMKGDLLMTDSSSGEVEIAVRNGNASEKLDISLESEIELVLR